LRDIVGAYDMLMGSDVANALPRHHPISGRYDRAIASGRLIPKLAAWLRLSPQPRA
jgi:hypothetical protein